jgi:hypothetical protein
VLELAFGWLGAEHITLGPGGYGFRRSGRLSRGTCGQARLLVLGTRRCAEDEEFVMTGRLLVPVDAYALLGGHHTAEAHAPDSRPGTGGGAGRQEPR